jgi:hypothetical protein
MTTNEVAPQSRVAYWQPQPLITGGAIIVPPHGSQQHSF